MNYKIKITDKNREVVKRIADDQWNTQEQSEWKPKRGERVLVWDDNEIHASEFIFLTYIEYAKYPVICVNSSYEKEFTENENFSTDE